MSKKISALAASALYACKYFKRSNTEVTVNGRVFLFGNEIAHREEGTNRIIVCFCGWPTRTTLDRINEISYVRYVVRKGRLCQNKGGELVEVNACRSYYADN